MRKIDKETELRRMVREYQRLVYTICYKSCQNHFEAEDLCQETWLSVYRHLESFDGRNEKAWICRIALNKCLDFAKSAQRRIQPTEDILLETVPDTRSQPEISYLEKEKAEAIRSQCRTLKEPYASVAVAHFVEEKSAAEIAGIRGKPVKTIQTQILRARRQLAALRKEGPD